MRVYAATTSKYSPFIGNNAFGNTTGASGPRTHSFAFERRDPGIPFANYVGDEVRVFKEGNAAATKRRRPSQKGHAR